jgi:glycosyltransferase involved in cell wall biosynthesis
VIGVSDDYLQWGQHKGSRRNQLLDRVFPLGYAPSIVPPSPEVDQMLMGMGVDPSATIVSFVGSWGATYDLDLVLETARQLSARRDILFVVAGDADTRPALKASFQELPNVVLSRWLGASQIAALLSKSRIGLLPYDTKAPQGLPNKVFEYLAYGPFQLSTLAGEVEDFYKQTAAGAYVRANPAALAEAISAYLLSDNAAARNARIALFRQRFDASLIYSHMIAHIESVAVNCTA